MPWYDAAHRIYMNEKKTATTSNNNIIKSIRIMRIGLITLYEPHFVFLFKPLRYYTFSISFHRLPWPLDFYYQFTLNVIVIWLYFFNFVRSLCGFLLCVQSVHTKIVFFGKYQTICTIEICVRRNKCGIRAFVL